jgi:coenzyme PQQ synthesis protein D (PqqD)
MARLAGHVRSAPTNDGAVLLDIQGGRMFALNPTGSRILELLEAGTAGEEIASQLAREFSVSLETAATDTDQFLCQLRRHSLLDIPR